MGNQTKITRLEITLFFICLKKGGFMNKKQLKYPGLVAEMARHGETEFDIGKLLNMSHASVSRRLCGKTRFRTEEIDILCEHFKKTYEELFQ